MQSTEDQTQHSKVRPHLPRLPGRSDCPQEHGKYQLDAGGQGLSLYPCGCPRRGGRPWVRAGQQGHGGGESEAVRTGTAEEDQRDWEGSSTG